MTIGDEESEDILVAEDTLLKQLVSEFQDKNLEKKLQKEYIELQKEKCPEKIENKKTYAENIYQNQKYTKNFDKK